MFKFILTGTTGIKSTFGRFSNICSPGLNLYIPFVQRIDLVSNRLNQNEFRFEIKTSDNIFSKLSMAVQHQIVPENSDKAFYSLAKPLEQINSYVESMVRTYTSNITLEELFKSQHEICRFVSDNLTSKMEAHGYCIKNTLVVSIDPAAPVKDAYNNIEASRRNKEAIRETSDAEFYKIVKAAEAEKAKKILYGQGISGQRKAIVDGYKDSISEITTNFGLSAADIINFLIITQKIDMMESVGVKSGTKTIFFDSENNSLLRNIVAANENNTSANAKQSAKQSDQTVVE